ncbi:MAG: hypothetical protein JXA87_09295 [Thermoleophilia bacterium]|nr:hypothetical protein [Thermoleophilia bacterium]
MRQVSDACRLGHFRKASRPATGLNRSGIRAVVVVAASLVIIGTACGAVFALGLPAQDPTGSNTPLAQVPVTFNSETTTISAPTVPTTAAEPDEYPDYRPDPVRTSTARSQSIGAKVEKSLAAAGLALAEAVEFTPLGGTDPVIEIALRSKSAESRALVIIWIFKTPDRPAVTSPVGGDESGGSAARMEIPGCSSEDMTILGASRAHCITGPFGSSCRILAELPSGMTINACSESAALKGEPLPLDRAGLQELVSLIAQEL